MCTNKNWSTKCQPIDVCSSPQALIKMEDRQPPQPQMPLHKLAPKRLVPKALEAL